MQAETGKGQQRDPCYNLIRDQGKTIHKQHTSNYPEDSENRPSNREECKAVLPKKQRKKGPCGGFLTKASVWGKKKKMVEREKSHQTKKGRRTTGYQLTEQGSYGVEMVQQVKSKLTISSTY